MWKCQIVYKREKIVNIEKLSWKRYGKLEYLSSQNRDMRIVYLEISDIRVVSSLDLL